MTWVCITDTVHELPPRQLPLRIQLRLLNPLIVRLRPLRLLRPNNPLKHLPNEPHKIRPSQCILPSPSPPLPLLSLHQLRIPRLLRLHPQIPRNSHKIEPRLPLGIPRNPPLQHLNHLLGECITTALAVADRIRLQPVKLIQHPVYRRVRNEMIHIPAFLLVLRSGRLVDERRCLCERVVRGANGLGVRECFAAEVGREAGREVLEGL